MSKKKMFVYVMCLCLFSVGLCQGRTLTVSVPEDSSELTYGIGRLKTVLARQEIGLTLSDKVGGDLTLHNARNPDPDCDYGYSLRKNGKAYAIHAQNNRGLLYGILVLLRYKRYQ